MDRPKCPRDINQLAAQIVAESTQEGHSHPHITVALSEHQVPERIRLDVTVVEDSETYTGVARVMPDGRIGVSGGQRLLPQPAVEQAVRAYLVQLSQQPVVA